jgi:2-hydroxy-3-oxopropionate reductase
MKVGFVGLGIMGRPMALNLLKAGHDVAVWARREQSMAPLLDAGATAAKNPADVAKRSQIVVSMVGDAPDVAAVMLGTDGVAEGAEPGLVAVDMSTILPDAAREIARKLGARGIDFLDAPVSGGEVGAISGALTIMVGGSEAGFVAAKPVFEAMGKTIVHIGPSGSGQVSKAANQIVTGVGVLMIAEMFNFVRKNGADPAKVREALMGGSGASKILENHGGRMLARNFKPGFKSWMHQKDMNIVLQTAYKLGVPLPATAAAAQMFNAMVGSNLGEEDSVAMVKLLEQLSGD